MDCKNISKKSLKSNTAALWLTMILSDILSQDKAIETLQRAFAAQKIPHAYIFAGAQGVGKFTAARCWAKLLLCRSPVKLVRHSFSEGGMNDFADSCGKCDSCQSFNVDSHPDFHHVYKELIGFTSDPQNRKKTPIDLPIDVVREFIIQKVQIKPALSAVKVFVVSESEKLNAAGQNALLKTLEEPPLQSFIILLCTKLNNLLPTARSRCQIVRFGPVSEEKIISHLAGIDRNEAKFWARQTGGSIGGAELLSKLQPSLYEIKKQFLKRLCTCRLADCVDLAQWVNSTAAQLTESWQTFKADTSKSDIGRQAKKTFVQVLISALDDAMKQGFIKSAEMINFDQHEQIKILAKKHDPQECAELIEDCFLAVRFIDASVNEKLVFERMLLNFANRL
jgi:DNA polymerase III subunit delta'